MSTRQLIEDVLVVGLAAAPSTALYLAINNSKMKGSTFALHPTFALAGFSTIMSGVYLAARTRPKNRKIIYIHGALNVAGTAMVLKAVNIMINMKNSNNKPHLQTPHSWLGGLTASLVVLQTINGTISICCPPKDAAQRKEFNKKHRKIGALTAGLFALAVATGTMSTFSKNPCVKFTGIATAVAAAVGATRALI